MVWQIDRGGHAAGARDCWDRIKGTERALAGYRRSGVENMGDWKPSEDGKRVARPGISGFGGLSIRFGND